MSGDAGQKRTRLLLGMRAVDDPRVLAGIEAAREAGHHLDVRVIFEAGQAETLTLETLELGAADTLIAGGGDGTLNEVATALLSSGYEELPALAVLPLGTGNDFAQTADVPLEDPAAALELALTSEPKSIDVGSLGERYFVNMASAGFGTDVTVETPQPLKEALGRVAYFLKGIGKAASHVEPSYAKLTGADWEWSGKFYALAIGNGRSAGGGLSMCPHAVLDDGYFDVAVLPEDPDGSFQHLVGDFMEDGLEGLQSKVVQVRLAEVSVEGGPDFIQFNLDGEPIRCKKGHFRLIPKALRFHLGPRAPLKG